MFTVIFLKERRGRERKHLPSVTGDHPAGNTHTRTHTHTHMFSRTADHMLTDQI